MLKNGHYSNNPLYKDVLNYKIDKSGVRHPIGMEFQTLLINHHYGTVKISHLILQNQVLKYSPSSRIQHSKIKGHRSS